MRWDKRRVGGLKVPRRIELDRRDNKHLIRMYNGMRFVVVVVFVVNVLCAYVRRIRFAEKVVTLGRRGILSMGRDHIYLGKENTVIYKLHI